MNDSSILCFFAAFPFDDHGGVEITPIQRLPAAITVTEVFPFQRIITSWAERKEVSGRE